ncbi:isochorismatase [Arsukibacterium ikkense]|uniref:Isochorismatase n=1 Tax=Arsukibacterium ikkense TaxID=336831 RepID=A0A0M2V8K2_9GAMM|nr:hydrolase [Arsukibacterium ikkense]KKO46941.1 isochorismatase [Arsukibacterium ikkense]
MLLQANNSLVLLIDIQQKLAPAIYDTKALEQAATWVLQVALQLDIPLLATEHYPKGLGHTVASIRELLSDEAVMEKIHFSAWREPAVQQQLVSLGRQQIVLIGTESHVCVLQTALDLVAAGYQVFVVFEAVGSRTPDNKQLALSRMQQAGCQIISKEMLAFEWLERGDHESFRQISKGWIR